MMGGFLSESVFENIWGMVSKPLFVVIYVVVIVFLMLVIIVTVLVNEHRFAAYSTRLANSADKAEQAAQEEASGSRFDMLTRIDERKKTLAPTEFETNFTLEELCETFRNYAAGAHRLYYSIDTIREFIASLSVSHIMILQGMSGTGKTSLAFAFGKFLDNESTVIPVQPMWKERSDLLGYYNEFTKRFNETLLLEKMYEANSRGDIYITVLDEMNIARVEYYFAEFLSMLELPDSESRYLDVVSDVWPDDPEDLKDGRIHLPDNMWFLGTANNDDSTFAISDKVYDRAMILNLNSKCEPFSVPAYRRMHVESKHFVELTQQAVAEHPVSPETIDKLKKIDAYLSENYRVSFGNRIMKQINAYLPVYVACGGEELDALDDMIAKKILRKLETQNMTYRNTELEALCNTFDDIFGADRMKRCLATVRHIAHNG